MVVLPAFLALISWSDCLPLHCSLSSLFLSCPIFIFDEIMEEKQLDGDDGKEEGGGRGREMVLFEGKQREVAEEQQKVKEYPAPLFKHEELCTDPGIFIEALRRFHSLMGTKFMIPVIGGRDLNLHRLYVEVTNRGGLEKVIVEKRWREVISIFNFPPTTTSASYVLRKYYLSLLHHFEQVYFFGVRGRLVPPAAALQTRTQLCKFGDIGRSDPGPAMRRKKTFPPAILRGSSPTEVKSTKQIPNGHISAEILSTEARHQHSRPAAVERPPPNANEFVDSNPTAPSCTPTSVAQSAPPSDGVHSYPASSSSTPPVHESMPSTKGSSRNFTVTGTIDGKFDYGYFVTVKIGCQLLHGVLYHIHQHHLGVSPDSSPHVKPIHQTPSPSSFAPAAMDTACAPYIPLTRSVGRRRRLKNRDPARPKPNRSAYNFFFAEKHYELRAQCPHTEREYSKSIGEYWSKLTDEERRVYEDYARRDKERYKKELQGYKESYGFAQPKQMEEMARGIEIARKEVARREMYHCSERIESAHSKKTARFPASTEDIAGAKMQDYSEDTKGEAIEEKPQELGKELMDSAMEIDVMSSSYSADVDREN